MSKSPPEQRAERRSRLIVKGKTGRFLLRLNHIEALDHSDVCLLKEWMCAQSLPAKVTLSLHKVQYLPPGFFGMLHDMVDRGINISLSHAEDCIKKHLWYKQFVNANGLFVVPKKAWIPTAHH